MNHQFTARRRKVLAGSLIALAVCASLYAIVIAVIEGVDSALAPILSAAVIDVNCALFLSGWTSRSRSN